VEDVSRQNPWETRNLVITVVVEDPEVLRVMPEVAEIYKGVEIASRIEPEGIITGGQQDGRREKRKEQIAVVSGSWPGD
jgi:hypothetical protein